MKYIPFELCKWSNRPQEVAVWKAFLLPHICIQIVEVSYLISHLSLHVLAQQLTVTALSSTRRIPIFISYPLASECLGMPAYTPIVTVIVHDAVSERWEETKAPGKDKPAGEPHPWNSRVSEDFVLLPYWTTEDGGNVSTSKVRLRYHSPAGQYFNSFAAIQEFLACSGTTGGRHWCWIWIVNGLIWFGVLSTPRKGRRLEAILEESTTSIGQQEQPENCVFFTELRW